jgi:hypothetical protein
MKTLNRSLKEAVEVCNGSGLYPHLTRKEKRAAVMYCIKIIGKHMGKRGL